MSLSPALDAARELVAALVVHGVREVVLCPGSRSAPLAHAVVAAERAGLLRAHVRIDERSAAFFALGLSRGALLGEEPGPAAVLTTSGTAAANLHPAVLEAHHDGIPLLVLTADRPHELWATGANQTTAQAALFGEATRMTAVVPAPTGREGERAELRSLVARAAHSARGGGRGGVPGPVHLDLAYRGPLAPKAGMVAGSSDAGAEAVSDVAQRVQTSASVHLPVWGDRQAEPRDAADRAMLEEIVAEPRTVVVAGTGAPRSLAAAAARQRWPLVAEVVSGLAGAPTAVPHYRAVLDAPGGLATEVRQVVVAGRPTLSREVAALVAGAPRVVTVLAPRASGAVDGWPELGHRSDVVLPAVPDSWLRAVAVPGRSATDTKRDWCHRWLREADRGAQPPVDPSSSSVAGVAPAALARTVLAACTAEDILVVGSSSPVRDIDDAWEISGAGALPTVVANRGLAGIDGTVSTAQGVALAATGGRVRALVGDLTFLHDVGGLWSARDESRAALQIVVVNDHGGSIFAGLEHGDAAVTGPVAAAMFRRAFSTPQDVELAALCRAYGIPHERVTSVAELHRALGRTPHGCTVIEVETLTRHRALSDDME